MNESTIRVHLLGQPCVIMDNIVVAFPYKKAEGLFYYLCWMKTITRSMAINIFWADCSENNARKNLRDALYHLKKTLNPEVITLAGNSTITLNPEVSVDLDQLRNNLLENYREEFLKDFYIKNCLEFEDWVENCQRSLKKQYTDALKEHIGSAISSRKASLVLELSGKLLDTFYIDEKFFRNIILFFSENGEYSSAISVYQHLVDIMHNEYELEPEAETLALFNQILDLRKKISHPHPENPSDFIGRKNELYEILDLVERHCVKRIHGSENCALIAGEAGIGKTALLEELNRLFLDNDYTVFSFCFCQTDAELYLKSWNDIIRTISPRLSDKEESFRTIRQGSDDFQDFHMMATQCGALLSKILQERCDSDHQQHIIFLLDNIQWMDSFSIIILTNLLFHMAEQPFFVIATSRLTHTKELEEMNISLARNSLIRQIPLKPFSLSETEELIQNYYPKLSLSADDLKQIYGYSNGNVFFLNELLNIIDKEGAHSLLHSALTPKISNIIRSRLMGLSPAEQELLDIISIAYKNISITQIKLILNYSELELYDLIENLIRFHFIVEEVDAFSISYGFSHVLVKNYILSKMSTGRKTSYYRVLALDAERRYQSGSNFSAMPELIFYFENAKDIYKFYYYKLEYYMYFFSGLQEVYPILTTKVFENLLNPDPDTSTNILIPLAQQIRDLPEDNVVYPELRMKMEYLIGRYDLSCGDYEKGYRNINTCIENALKLNNARYLMNSYLQLIYYAIQIYDLGMMDQYISHCEDLLTQHEYPPLEIYAISRLRALYYIKTRHFEEAADILTELIHKLEGIKRTVPNCTTSLIACYNYMGEIEMEKHHWENALEYVSKAVCSNQYLPLTSGLGMAYTNLGIIYYQLEKYKESSSYFEEARKCFHTVSIQWGRSKEEAYSAYLDIKLDKIQSAANHYTLACKYAEKDYSPHLSKMLEDLYQVLRRYPNLSLPLPHSA